MFPSPSPRAGGDSFLAPPRADDGVSRSTTSPGEAIDYEKETDGIATARPSSEAFHRTYSSIVPHNVGVNVKRAEADFAELSRELSNISAQHGRLSRSQSRRSQLKSRDEEKAIGVSPSESEETADAFDLEAILRGSKEEDDASGIKSKRIGVVWDALTVKGLGGVKNYVKIFPQAFWDFINVYGTAKSLLGIGAKGREFNILTNFRGVLKPGEMCLVLGKPGSGCTSFLKVISNQRYGYTSVEGEVLYGQFDSSTFEKRYRGEAVYNGEDDIHHPTLTVGQTLDFALDTKIPGKRQAGLSRADFKEKVITLMLNMFNITHTRDTIVGDPFVRGISGGERKRVSIAEMMVTGATVCSWDNTTRGLDASTAVDWARSLRVLTDIYGMTSFVSLYQASETIYQQFEKVMVIDEGRCVYYGPAKSARAYFEGLGFLEKPRQTTPDYLTGCTDPFEREFRDGRSAADVPSTPDALAKAYSESAEYAAMDQEMKVYKDKLSEEKHVFEDFQQAVKDSKRHTSSKNVYTIPFYLQTWALMKRQFLLKWQVSFLEENRERS